MNEKNEELAEFFGILLGDGKLNKSSNCITIVGSLEEVDYYNSYVIPIIRSLFEVKPKLRYRRDRNAIYIDFNSKRVMDYLTNSIGLVRGSKVNAHVPSLIKNDYPRIQFCFSDTPFAHEVKGLLEEVGFNFGMWKDPRFNGLLVYQISGSDNLEKWMKTIGSSNPVQKTKYQVWKKYGFYVPKSSLK